MLQKSDPLNLGGKVAVMTGGSSGIGLAIVEILSAYGASVALVADGPSGADRAAEISAAGRDVAFFRCDVTREDQVEATVDAVCERFGRIDILCNNAGVTVRKDLTQLTEQEWDHVIDVGLKGTFLFSKYVVPHMAATGGGSIINTGSGWGLEGGKDAAAYCAVKGGIVNLTRAMAIDYGAQHIRVNSVDPGDVDTPMLRDEGRQIGAVLGDDPQQMEAYLKACGEKRVLGRLGTTEDIANAVLFLASDLSSWMTGAALVVNGGGCA